MPNPFLNMDREIGRRLDLAFDSVGGRGAALRSLGLDRETIADPRATALVLHRRFGDPENVLRRLAAPRLAMDAALVEEHDVKTPEQALKALQGTNPEVLQDGGVDPETDPRVSFIRHQLSPGDWTIFIRMLRDVQHRWETPAHDRGLAHDRDFRRTELSPAEFQAYTGYLRDLARIGSKAPMAHDAASASAGFKRMFPDASLPETIHY